MTLTEAVDALTKPTRTRVHQGDRETWITHDPLLQQLSDAIRSTIGRSGHGSSATDGTILDSDALHRFMTITAQIGDWCRMAGVKPTRDPIRDLRAWHVARLAATDDENAFYVRQLAQWAEAIHAKLNPRRSMEFTAPCPICDASTWVNDAGDEVPYPVKIEYDPDAGNTLETARAICRKCSQVWEGEWGEWGLRSLRRQSDTRHTMSA